MTNHLKSAAPWQIFGLDETGAGQLRDWHIDAIARADLIFADSRFHDMLRQAGASQLESWPKPFSDLKTKLTALQTKTLAFFTTGDPLYFGAGATIARYFPEQEIAITPALSGIQLAAAQKGWQVTDCEILSVHGRAAYSVIPYLYPFAKWLVIPKGASSLHDISDILCAHGCQMAEVTALMALGRAGEEAIITKSAKDWLATDVAGYDHFFMMAIDMAPAGRFRHHSRAGVLPDDAFISDGKLTKQEARASAMAKLQPHPHGVLWDLGTGCGSIAIEWARSHAYCKAYGIDSRDDRLERARANAERLGTPLVEWVAGDSLDVIADLPEPDAVFIGGGLSDEVLARVLDHLPQGGRLVCHAVTLESEAILLAAHKTYGGSLTRIAVNKAEPVGAYYGWRGLMPVTQWVLIKETIR